MVSTVDGAATGPDGRSGGINNAADKRVFDTLRRLCDAVVVGAGTARDEGYRAVPKPLVLVSRRGEVPVRLRDAPAGSVLMATCAAAEHLDETRALLGDDQVLVLGQHRVDLAELKRDPGRARPHEPAQRGRAAAPPRSARRGRRRRAGPHRGARACWPASTPGSRTARPSTCPSRSRCCSRTAGRYWAAG